MSNEYCAASPATWVEALLELENDLRPYAQVKIDVGNKFVPPSKLRVLRLADGCLVFAEPVRRGLCGTLHVPGLKSMEVLLDHPSEGAFEARYESSSTVNRDEDDDEWDDSARY